MANNTSMVGWMSRAPIIGNVRIRRIVIVVLVAICAVLTLFPQRYRAALSLTPSDPPSLGLSSATSQFGALNSVFGNQSSVEVSLKLGGSPYVRSKVADRLKLDQQFGMTRTELLRWLDRKVDVRSMRGGIVQIEIKLADAALGQKIVGAYGEAIREQQSIVSRNQIRDKRQVLVDLVREANNDLKKAQAAYDDFRLKTRYSQPGAAITAIGERIPALEQAVKAKQVELNAKRQFVTDDNMRVRQVLAEIDALNAQLTEARSVSPDKQNSVGRVVQESTEADRLRRELQVQQTFFDSYSRFLQSTAAENLTSTVNMRILEPAYVDPARQYNRIPLMIGVFILLLGLAIEFYNLRPPLQDRKLA